MGGILLVDEAYYLYNAANDRDYGQESIEILLNVMENNKEDLIVVMAGYADRMATFYGNIPGALVGVRVGGGARADRLLRQHPRCAADPNPHLTCLL